MANECQCKKNEITREQLAQIDSIIERYGARQNYLILVLKETQELFGYLPAQIQRYIARGLNLNPSQVFGVVSFYSFFTMVPRGRHTIRVCLGTACYVKRSDEVLEKLKDKLDVEVGKMTQDGRYSLESVRCLGACGLAPVVVVDNDTHGAVDSVKIMDIINQYN